MDGSGGDETHPVTLGMTPLSVMQRGRTQLAACG